MGSAVVRRHLGYGFALVLLVACGGGGGSGSGGDDPADGSSEVSFQGVSGVDGRVGTAEALGLGGMVAFATALAEAILPDEIAGFVDSDIGSVLKPESGTGPGKPGFPSCPTVTSPGVAVRNVDFTDCGTAFDGNVTVAWSILDSNFAIAFQPDFEIAGIDVTGALSRERLGAVGEGLGEVEIPGVQPVGVTFLPGIAPIGIVTPPEAAPTMLTGPLTALRVDIGGSVGAREILAWGAADVIVGLETVVVQLGGEDGPDADDLPDRPMHWSDDGCICPDGGIVQVDMTFTVDEVDWVYAIDGEDVTVTCTLAPPVELTGTLAIEFDGATDCGAFSASFTPDATSVSVAKADLVACVEASGLPQDRQDALTTYIQGAPGSEVTVPTSVIQPLIDEAVENAIAAGLPSGFCQPELGD